ncbi:MAG: hypothetical protein RLZZ214_716, partial [Verrucomicrobiota bacterium]
MLDERRRQQESAARTAQVEQNKAAREAERAAKEAERAAIKAQEDDRARGIREAAAQGAKIETDIPTGKRTVATHPDGKPMSEAGPVGKPFLQPTAEAAISSIPGMGGFASLTRPADKQRLDQTQEVAQKFRDDSFNTVVQPLPSDTDPKTGAITGKLKDEFGAPQTVQLGTDQGVQAKVAKDADLELRRQELALRTNRVDQDKKRFTPQWDAVEKPYNLTKSALEKIQSKPFRRNAKGEWEKFDPDTNLAIPVAFDKRNESKAEIAFYEASLKDAQIQHSAAKAKYEKLVPFSDNLKRNDEEIEAARLKLTEEKILHDSGIKADAPLPSFTSEGKEKALAELSTAKPTTVRLKQQDGSEADVPMLPLKTQDGQSIHIPMLDEAGKKLTPTEALDQYDKTGTHVKLETDQDDSDTVSPFTRKLANMDIEAARVQSALSTGKADPVEGDKRLQVLAEVKGQTLNQAKAEAKARLEEQGREIASQFIGTGIEAQKLSGNTPGTYATAKGSLNEAADTRSGVAKALEMAGGDIDKAIKFANREFQDIENAANKIPTGPTGFPSPGAMSIDATRATKFSGAAESLTKMKAAMDAAGIAPEDRADAIQDAAKIHAWTENDTDNIRQLKAGDIVINPGRVFGQKDAIIAEINASKSSPAQKKAAVARLDAMRKAMAEQTHEAIVKGEQLTDKVLGGIPQFTEKWTSADQKFKTDYDVHVAAKAKEGITDKAELIDSYMAEKDSRWMLTKLYDALGTGIASGAVGIGKTGVGIAASAFSIADMATGYGSGPAASLGQKQVSMQGDISAMDAAGKTRGLTGGYVIASDLANTVTQMAPMFIGGAAAQGLKGIAQFATRHMAVGGWAAAQGWESATSQALQYKAEQKGSALTPDEIVATLQDPKVIAGAFANAAQTLALTYLFREGAERMALGIRGTVPEAMTVRQFLGKGGLRVLKDGTFRKEITALGRNLRADALDEGAEESLNQAFETFIVAAATGKDIKLGDAIEQWVKAGGMGMAVGAGVNQVRMGGTPESRQKALVTALQNQILGQPERSMVSTALAATDPQAKPATETELKAARQLVQPSTTALKEIEERRAAYAAAIKAKDYKGAAAIDQEINDKFTQAQSDAALDAADAVMLTRELGALEQQGKDAIAQAEQAVTDAWLSGDKKAAAIAEANLEQVEKTAPNVSLARAAVKLATGQDIGTLTDSELRAVGYKPGEDGAVVPMTPKELKDAGMTKPLIRRAADGTAVILDEAIDQVIQTSSLASNRIQLGEQAAMEAAQARFDAAQAQLTTPPPATNEQNPQGTPGSQGPAANSQPAPTDPNASVSGGGAGTTAPVSGGAGAAQPKSLRDQAASSVLKAGDKLIDRNTGETVTVLSTDNNMGGFAVDRNGKREAHINMMHPFEWEDYQAPGTGAPATPGQAPVSGNVATLDADAYERERAINPALPEIKDVVRAAFDAGQPVSVSMVDRAGGFMADGSGIQTPPGYTRRGDMLVPPAAPTPAAPGKVGGTQLASRGATVQAAAAKVTGKGANIDFATDRADAAGRFGLDNNTQNRTTTPRARAYKKADGSTGIILFPAALKLSDSDLATVIDHERIHLEQYEFESTPEGEATAKKAEATFDKSSPEYDSKLDDLMRKEYPSWDKLSPRGKVREASRAAIEAALKGETSHFKAGLFSYLKAFIKHLETVFAGDSSMSKYINGLKSKIQEGVPGSAAAAPAPVSAPELQTAEQFAATGRTDGAQVVTAAIKAGNPVSVSMAAAHGVTAAPAGYVKVGPIYEKEQAKVTRKPITDSELDAAEKIADEVIARLQGSTRNVNFAKQRKGGKDLSGGVVTNLDGTITLIAQDMAQVIKDFGLKNAVQHFYDLALKHEVMHTAQLGVVSQQTGIAQDDPAFAQAFADFYAPLYRAVVAANPTAEAKASSRYTQAAWSGLSDGYKGAEMFRMFGEDLMDGKSSEIIEWENLGKNERSIIQAAIDYLVSLLKGNTLSIEAKKHAVTLVKRYSELTGQEISADAKALEAELNTLSGTPPPTSNTTPNTPDGRQENRSEATPESNAQDPAGQDGNAVPEGQSPDEKGQVLNPEPAGDVSKDALPVGSIVRSNAYKSEGPITIAGPIEDGPLGPQYPASVNGRGFNLAVKFIDKVESIPAPEVATDPLQNARDVNGTIREGMEAAVKAHPELTEKNGDASDLGLDLGDIAYGMADALATVPAAQRKGMVDSAIAAWIEDNLAEKPAKATGTTDQKARRKAWRQAAQDKLNAAARAYINSGVPEAFFAVMQRGRITPMPNILGLIRKRRDNGAKLTEKEIAIWRNESEWNGALKKSNYTGGGQNPLARAMIDLIMARQGEGQMPNTIADQLLPKVTTASEMFEALAKELRTVTSGKNEDRAGFDPMDDPNYEPTDAEIAAWEAKQEAAAQKQEQQPYVTLADAYGYAVEAFGGDSAIAQKIGVISDFTDRYNRGEMPLVRAVISAEFERHAQGMAIPEWDAANPDLMQGPGAAFLKFFRSSTPESLRATMESLPVQDTGSALFSSPAPTSQGRGSIVEMPPAVIGHSLDATKHPEYAAAKAGNPNAALRVARDLVTPQMRSAVKALIGDSTPVIVPVVAIEATGNNMIPQMVAIRLEESLGLSSTAEIVQSVRAHRSDKSGLDRVFSQPEFSGPVEQGQTYLLVDDTLTQGGTFAALADYITRNGGEVVGAVALTGKQYSATLRLSEPLLAQLRKRLGDLEDTFRTATGHGFERLTESEARTLVSYGPLERVRARILEAAVTRGDGLGTLNEGQGDSSLGSSLRSSPSQPGFSFDQTTDAGDASQQGLDFTASQATPAAPGRFRPKTLVEFAKPYRGPSGAELQAYEWKHTLQETVDKRGEDAAVRVSNWEDAATNMQTGREIVHQFHVTTKDGKAYVVSLESALKILGYTSENGKAAGPVRNLASMLRTRAQLAMEAEALRPAVEANEAKTRRYEQEQTALQRQRMPKPVFTVEEGRPIMRIGALEKWGTLAGTPESFAKRSEYDLRTLEEEWRREQARAVAGLNGGEYNTGSKLREIEARIARMDRKIQDAAAAGSSNQVDPASADTAPLGLFDSLPAGPNTKFIENTAKAYEAAPEGSKAREEIAKVSAKREGMTTHGKVQNMPQGMMDFGMSGSFGTKDQPSLFDTGPNGRPSIQTTDGGTLEAPGQISLFSSPAYHGTPHKVDKFSLDKIGTGEGAQAYGWGLYFADSKEVGEGYRQRLSGGQWQGSDGTVYQPLEIREAVEKKAKELGFGIRAATDAADNWSSHAKGQDMSHLAAFEAIRQVVVEKGIKVQQTGNLYRVELDVEDSDLLDWDKPLSEQSEKVKASLGEIGILSDRKGHKIYEEVQRQAFKDKYGERPDAYEDVNRFGLDKEAS